MDDKYIELLGLVRLLGEVEGSSLATAGVHASYEERAKNLRIKVKELCAEIKIETNKFHPFI